MTNTLSDICGLGQHISDKLPGLSVSNHIEQRISDRMSGRAANLGQGVLDIIGYFWLFLVISGYFGILWFLVTFHYCWLLLVISNYFWLFLNIS